MNPSEVLDNTIRISLEDSFGRVRVPELSRAAISARAARIAVVPHSARSLSARFAFAALTCVIILGLLFAIPGLPGSIARAAQFFTLRLHYWHAASNGVPAQSGTSVRITLAQARANVHFGFVDPHGLPAGTVLDSVLQGPAFVHYVVTLAYRTSDGRNFLITESPAEHVQTASKTICFAPRIAAPVKKPLSAKPFIVKPVLMKYVLTGNPDSKALAHARALLLDGGAQQTPCPTKWTVDGTRLSITQSALTQSEELSIARATRLR